MSQLIDVGELLNDPELVEPIMLIKRAECVNDFGQNTLSEEPVKTHGSVQPVSGKTLQRLPEALRIANVQSFWLKHKLVSDNRSKYPDVIVKGSKRFTVQMVFDWSDWGSGWTEGTCVAERPSG